MNSITITIPVPPRKLSPNSRTHWAVKAKIVKAARNTAFYAARETLNGRTPPGWLKAKMEVKAYFKTIQHPDPDNFIASLKSSIDGIADSGIIDDDKSLWPERPEFHKDARNPRVEITITKED